VTFRFIMARSGHESLIAYWQELGRRYYAPVSRRWSTHGLHGVAEHWREFFKPEPGAEVEVHESDVETRLEIRVCPLIKHLRENRREIVRSMCQHCYFVNEAIAAPAGLTARVSGGNGCSTQRFFKPDAATPPQNLEDIATAS
jgi:hypothetical protein